MCGVDGRYGVQGNFMNRARRCCLVVLLLACSSVESVPPGCTCAANKLKPGWCEVCKVGYLASIKIESKMLFETLDAHGHDIDPTRFQCETCKKAIKEGGYCDGCRMGFIRGQAYLSRLTYQLARGVPRDVVTIECATCRKNAERFGWCERCRTGMVGNVAIADKREFERTVPEVQRLLDAIKMLTTCETCGIALFSGGYCPVCKKSFVDGKAVPSAP